jgi:ATP-dependent RNA helicase DDX58
MKITDIDMLIMDECHHTDLEHSYNAIMAFYHELRPGNPSAKLPQIIGLTASLGVGDCDDEPLKHYKKICANLDCDCITHVKVDTPDMEELLHHSPRPEAEQIISVDPCSPDAPFFARVSTMMQDIEMQEVGGIKLLYARGTQQYENQIVEVS